MNRPVVIYSSPRMLPPAASLSGRVVVLDIAFAADGLGTSFEETTLSFIQQLGDRLAVWIDHHDHERHGDFAGDPRFVLCRKVDHGACPEMVTKELVHRVGTINTIVCHLDVDGIYAAAKWIRGGEEPYGGADDDARAIDTRIGTPGAIADMIDKALRAHFRDAALKHRILDYLVSGLRDEGAHLAISAAAADFDDMANEARRLSEHYERKGRVAYVDAQFHARRAYDKTLLLLLGQERAEVAIVRDGGMITVAAAFESGLDFIKLLNLGGGMPTRVSLPEKRLGDVLTKLNG